MQAPTFQFTIKFFLMSNNMPEKRAYLFFLKKKSSDQRLSANQILAITNFKLYGIFIAKKKKTLFMLSHFTMGSPCYFYFYFGH